MGRRIEVVEYDPEWPSAFRDEVPLLAEVFGSSLEAIHHVGSTSVPGLAAKPVIDVLVILDSTGDMARFDRGMTGLGYQVRGECLDTGGTPGRFYFSKPVSGPRTHHVHACAAGHFQIAEMLAFSRYLRERQDVALVYARLKRAAAAESPDDNVQYMASKHEWVRTTIDAAMAHCGESLLDLELQTRRGIRATLNELEAARQDRSLGPGR